MYDAALGRFHTPDMMAPFQPGITPYSVSFNNPILYVDYYGLGPIHDFLQKVITSVVRIFGFDTKGKILPLSKNGERRGNFEIVRQKRMRTQNQSNSEHVITPQPHQKEQLLSYIDPIPPKSFDVKKEIGIPPFYTNYNEKPNSRDLSFNDPFAGKTPSTSNFYMLSFVGGTDEILGTEQNIKLLQGLLLNLIDDPSLFIEIAGNTGTDPNASYSNITLNGKPSTIPKIQSARADAIKKYLINNGILPERIRTKTGKDYPNKKGYSVTITNYE